MNYNPFPPTYLQLAILKKEHPDCLHIFHLGDVCHAYGADAPLIGQAADVPCYSHSSLSMVQFAAYRLDDVVNALVGWGHLVAINEPVSVPVKGGGFDSKGQLTLNFNNN